MPKITPSALISEIKGRLKGSVFQMWRGQICLRGFNPGRFSMNPGRARFQGFANDIAGCYYLLSDSQKNNWISYSDLLPTQMSGFDAFFGRNHTNLCASHPDLVFRSASPSTYNPPSTPSPFSVSYLPALDSFCLSWTSPALSSLYVQGFFAPQIGYDQKSSPPFRMIETVASSLLCLSLPVPDYSSGRNFYFKVRSLNAYGEPSVYSSILTRNKT